MSTVAAGIKALLSGARTARALARKVTSSEALQARLSESIAEIEREERQVVYAVCKALVALGLECEPSADKVNEFMSEAVNDPAFPHRAYRLLGEARRAASRRRRAFLAAMVFGLPFAKLPDDERDRVDMVVERIMPADVELLRQIAGKNRTARPSTEEQPYFFKGSKLVAFVRASKSGSHPPTTRPTASSTSQRTTTRGRRSIIPRSLRCWHSAASRFRTRRRRIPPTAGTGRFTRCCLHLLATWWSRRSRTWAPASTGSTTR